MLLSNIFGSGGTREGGSEARIWNEERERERRREEAEEERIREREGRSGMSDERIRSPIEREKTDEDRWLDDVLQEMIDEDEDDYISVSFRDQNEGVVLDSGFLEHASQDETIGSPKGKERYQGSVGRITEEESIEEEIIASSSVDPLPISLVPNPALNRYAVPATSFYSPCSFSPPLDPPPLEHSPPSLHSSRRLSTSVEDIIVPYTPPLLIESRQNMKIEQQDFFSDSRIVVPFGPPPFPLVIPSPESSLSLALSSPAPRKQSRQEQSRWISTIPRSLSVLSSPSSYINRTHPRSGIISSPTSRSTSPTSTLVPHSRSKSNSNSPPSTTAPIFPSFSTIQSFYDRVDFGIDPTAMDFWSYANGGRRNRDLVDEEVDVERGRRREEGRG